MKMIKTHQKHSTRWYAVVPHLNQWQRFFFEKGLPEQMKVEEVAALFMVHPETVRRWDTDGLLISKRTGPQRPNPKKSGKSDGKNRDRRYSRDSVLKVFEKGLFQKK